MATAFGAELAVALLGFVVFADEFGPLCDGNTFQLHKVNPFTGAADHVLQDVQWQ
jgi:hypothetical protein